MVVVAWGVWTAYTGYRAAQDLDRAQDAADRLRSAVDAGDAPGRTAALADLEDAAAAAADRTDGVLWGAATLVPVVGDDAEGVERLAASLDVLAAEGLAPLLDTTDALDTLVGADGVDTAALAALQDPVARARAAADAAVAEVDGLDPTGYDARLRGRFEEYVDRVGDLAGTLGAAETATSVLPGMLGADGPRDYLLVFQNNAEIRATGGLPGSWARVHVDDGRLELAEQGSAADFDVVRGGVAPLSDEELAVYGPPMVQYWQDPGFTPDFPRAAEILRAFWDDEHPDVALDGVLALDPVGTSYLIAGTGPIAVGDVTLTAADVVEQVLSRPYLELAPAEQDAYFEDVAAAVVGAVAGRPASPVDLVSGAARAAREGRLLVAPFVAEDAERLAGTAVLGELSGDDGATPHVDVGLNDNTGAKMSYYLRQDTEVEATACGGSTQKLTGTTTLTQTIPRAEAARLPASVTGGGFYGAAPGTQVVAVRLYGPYGGSIGRVRLDGEDVAVEQGLTIEGRPVVTVGPELDGSAPVEITWAMTTAAGQDGDAVLRQTPGVEPGGGEQAVPSAC